MKNWILYIFCFCCCTSVFGQMTVTTELGPPPYVAGQPIPVRIKITHPPTANFGAVAQEELAKEFSIIRDPGKFETVQNSPNVVLQKEILITSSFSGDLLLPPVLANFFVNGQETSAVSKVKKITVAPSAKGEPKKEYPMPITDEAVAAMNEMISSGIANGAFQNQQGNQQGTNPAMGNDPIANPYGEIKDIKPIIEEPLKFQDFLPYLLAIFLLVAMISAVFYFLNKRKQPEAAPEPEVWIPAHETALADLTTLKEKQLWQNGATKEYQTELTHIIRKFLENRFEINALEMTSDDIVYHLKKKTAVSATQQGKVKDILQMADLVKFAKANPPVNINEQFWGDAENFVQETKTDEIPLSFLERQPGYQSEGQAIQAGVAAAGATTIAAGVTNSVNVDMLASRVKRFIATLIDAICFSLIYAIIATFLLFIVPVEQFSATAAILYYVILLALVFTTYWLFFGYFNSNHRQSLGKKLMGIVVTDKTLGPLSLSKSSIRSLIYFVESITALPLLWIFFDREKQTLHDKAVDSIVINKNYLKESEILDA